MVPFCHQETPCLVQNKLFINCLFENNANFPLGLTTQFLSPLWYSFPTSIARLCSYLHFYCLLTTSSNQMQKANSFFPKIQHLCVSLGAAGGDTQGSTRAQWNNSGQCHDFSIPQLSHPLQGFSQSGGVMTKERFEGRQWDSFVDVYRELLLYVSSSMEESTKVLVWQH